VTPRRQQIAFIVQRFEHLKKLKRAEWRRLGEEDLGEEIWDTALRVLSNSKVSLQDFQQLSLTCGQPTGRRVLEIAVRFVADNQDFYEQLDEERL